MDVNVRVQHLKWPREAVREVLLAQALQARAGHETRSCPAARSPCFILQTYQRHARS
jgi:hypothetical protein